MLRAGEQRRGNEVAVMHAGIAVGILRNDLALEEGDEIPLLPVKDVVAVRCRRDIGLEINWKQFLIADQRPNFLPRRFEFAFAEPVRATKHQKVRAGKIVERADATVMLLIVGGHFGGAGSGAVRIVGMIGARAAVGIDGDAMQHRQQRHRGGIIGGLVVEQDRSRFGRRRPRCNRHGEATQAADRIGGAGFGRLKGGATRLRPVRQLGGDGVQLRKRRHILRRCRIQGHQHCTEKEIDEA
jgi:hypothetical protein